MRIFSKKNFEFANPANGEKIRLKTMEFANLPEWAAKDPLFLWAKAEGSLEVFGEDKAGKSKGKVKKEDDGPGNEGVKNTGPVNEGAKIDGASGQEQLTKLPEGTE